MNSKWSLTFLIGIPLVLAAIFGGLYFKQPTEYKSEEFLMDTLVSISTFGTDTDLLQKATLDAFAEMRRLAELTDRFSAADTASQSTSDVDKVNKMAGIKPVQVDPDVFAMIQASQEYFVLTQGAFDITVGPLMDLWGFGKNEQHVPDAQELKQALALVGGNNLVLDKNNRTVFLTKPGMSLDLGAVAKGYALEKAAFVLQQSGITRALINAGGNVRVIGKKAKNTPWKVGIQDPRASSELIGVLDLDNEAATTSGDYNRTFTLDGKQYHHIISPLTGFPANSSISVTVVTPDAFKGDLLSTTLFLLNSAEALKLAEALSDTEAIIVTSQKEILATTGLAGKAKIKAAGYSYDQN